MMSLFDEFVRGGLSPEEAAAVIASHRNSIDAVAGADEEIDRRPIPVWRSTAMAARAAARADEPETVAGDLAALIRRRLTHDPEVVALEDATRTIPPLPRTIRPALFTRAGLEAEFGVEPASGWYGEPIPIRGSGSTYWAALGWHRRRRLVEILTANFFDPMRSGQLVVNALKPSGEQASPPPETWSVAAVSLDLATGVVAAGGAVMFVGVDVATPATPPHASRQVLDRFVAMFDAEMRTMQRYYALEELVAAVRQCLGAGSSKREIAAALRRASVTSWASGGRRLVSPQPGCSRRARVPPAAGGHRSLGQAADR
jgi:hypothetical protein